MTVSTLLTINSAGSITCGASTWDMLGSGAGTGWSAAVGSTIDAGTSTIAFSGAGEKYAAFGLGQTVNQLTNSGAFTPSTGGDGTNWLNLTTDTTVRTLTNTVTPVGFKFTATPTVGNLSIAGVSGSLVYLQGNLTNNGVYLQNIPYVSLLNASTTGGAGWYLGYTAVDNGGSTGWHFINSSAFSGMSFF